MTFQPRSPSNEKLKHDSADVVLRLRDVWKAFRDTQAIEFIDLDVTRGEFMTLLGPSGSGKTTLLRLIAGFEMPDAGTIELDGIDITRTPPFDRNLNTAFQSYALFPQMSVEQNIAYSLQAKGIRGRECANRVDDVLRIVRLSELAKRRPDQLSDGQRQRVGLARAIAARPTLLLLDEPLGGLDEKLRRDMQIELKHIQREIGITFLYVTHDQEEALSLSNRIAILNAGRIEQVDTPRGVYDRPATPFVAAFVGTSNLLERDGKLLVLRPEKLRVLPINASLPGPPSRVERGTLEEEVFLGIITKYVVRLDDGTRLEACLSHASDGPSVAPSRLGEAVFVVWNPDTITAIAYP